MGYEPAADQRYDCSAHGPFQLEPNGRLTHSPVPIEPLDPASPVPGVWRKLIRAREHCNALVVEIGRFSRENPVQFDGARDGDTVIEFKINQPVAPDPMVGVIIGDCVHNLRSALDHLIFAVATRFNDPSDPFPEDQIQFPIFDRPETFNGQFGRTKRQKRPLYGLPPFMRPALENLQPYQSGHLELQWLAVLSNWDKHRTIHTVGEIASKTSIQVWTGNIPRVRVTQRPFRHGDTIRVGVGSCPDDQLKIASDITMNVAFTDPPLENCPVVATLWSITDYIESQIVRLFEAVLDRS